jgi:plastocyanin
LIMSLATTLVLALAILSAASAETFQVTWDFIPNASLDVKVGDTLAFTWLSELHDVYIHPTLDCTDTGAIAVYAPATQGGSPTYTFTAEDASPGGNDMFFACQIGTHCSGANVNLAVKVFPGDAAPEVSTAPTAAPVDVVTPPPVDAPTEAPVDVVTLSPIDAPTDAPTAAPVDIVTPPPIDAPTEAPVGIVAPTLTPEDVPGETDAPTATPADAAPATRSINIGFLGIVAMAVVFAF